MAGGLGVFVVCLFEALVFFILLNTSASFFNLLLLFRFAAYVQHPREDDTQQNPTEDLADGRLTEVVWRVRVGIFNVRNTVAIAIFDFVASWLESSANTRADLEGEPNLRLPFLCVERRVEVIVEDVSKNPVINIAEVLANYGEVTITNIPCRKVFGEDVVLGVEGELGLLGIIAEIEG